MEKNSKVRVRSQNRESKSAVRVWSWSQESAAGVRSLETDFGGRVRSQELHLRGMESEVSGEVGTTVQ